MNINAGDTAWLLLSSALVLLMILPLRDPRLRGIALRSPVTPQ